MLLQNLPPRHVTEAAIAAAQLLPHKNPAAARVLRRPDAVPALVAAFLEEHAHTDLDPVAGKLNYSLLSYRKQIETSCLPGQYVYGLRGY